MGKCQTFFVLLLLVLAGAFLYNNIDTTHASVENAHIVKETVTELTNDGTSKYVIYHLIMDCHVEPYNEMVLANVKCYGKNKKFLGETNYEIYGYGDNLDMELPKYSGGIKKVKVTILPYNNKLIHLENKLCSISTYKLKKNKTKIDNTYEVVTPSYDYSSSSDDEDDYYSSYDSYYDSDYSGNSYASEPVSGGSYVASKNSDKFHYSYCGHAERIKSYNRIYFSSRGEALDSGYEPCGHCNP